MTITPQLKHKIIKQFEFYFSESNLPKDEHLRTLIASHAVREGEGEGG